MAITYQIEKKQEVYYENIIISGNTLTRDKVIRRELDVHEQERFDGDALKKSIRKLYRLNYFEDIKEVGPGGHFLGQRSTRKAIRSSEFVMPALADRNPFNQWAALGRPDLYDKARKKVEEILASPQKNPLPDDVIGKLENIMRKADKVLLRTYPKNN